jgi:3-carboxy-cis,cis-muconate cycloisomerase
MTNALLQNGLFGTLFGDAEISGEFCAEAMLARMLRFEEAWTRALVANGAVDAADGAQALEALCAFDAARFHTASERDGLPVPSLVAHLRQGLAPGAAQAIHSGVTSQDVIDTAMVLTCLSLVAILESRLDRLVVALQDLNARHGTSLLVARTRMQAALPATVSLRVSAWLRLVKAQRDRSSALREDLAKVQIGGAIGLRDAPEGLAIAVSEQVACALGLRLAPVWHADRAPFVTFGHWLTLVAGAVGKIGQDVALMAQQGLDEISLEGGGGSSAMPHKQNPIAAETIVALARHVACLQGTLAQAMIHEQERSGAAWALEWLTLPVMAEATGAALRHALELIGSVERIGTPG